MSVFIKPVSVNLFRHRALVVIALCAALLCSPATGVKGDDQIIEEGKFRLFEARHLQGEETYKITRDGDDLILTATLDLSPLDVEGPLVASLRVRRDLTPRQLTIKGRKASGNEIDLSVVVEGPGATVREGEQTRKIAVPGRFFTLSGYAPVSLQMMLIRYLAAQGVKNPVDILPAGRATADIAGATRLISGARKSLSTATFFQVLAGAARPSGWTIPAASLPSSTSAGAMSRRPLRP